MAVDFKELLEAFEFASSAPDGEIKTYPQRISCKIYG
jgi:hypothetical protein